VTFGNAYLISRDDTGKTVSQAIKSGDAALIIPAELGIRLSSVFMFDRLIFVEGPSDESVLRELAAKLEIDFSKSNAGFVHMTGVHNFAHFAAESTLELLSRRRVHMFFLADRDEREDDDVKRMMGRLGNRAHLHVLERRELENYLIDVQAILRLVRARLEESGRPFDEVTEASLASELQDSKTALKPEVIRLKMVRAVLRPIHLIGRSVEGTFEERLRNARENLDARLNQLPGIEKEITAATENNWGHHSGEMVPGTELARERRIP
jgi:hypothetical protein